MITKETTKFEFELAALKQLIQRGEKIPTWDSRLPENFMCDMCEVDLKHCREFVDGRLADVWGCFCTNCFKMERGTFGKGNGQRYILAKDGKWYKVEG